MHNPQGCLTQHRFEWTSPFIPAQGDTSRQPRCTTELHERITTGFSSTSQTALVLNSIIFLKLTDSFQHSASRSSKLSATFTTRLWRRCECFPCAAAFETLSRNTRQLVVVLRKDCNKAHRFGIDQAIRLWSKYKLRERVGFATIS